MTAETSIAYYISSHGYGHGVRSCSIIRAINEIFPEIEVHIVTTLPESFLTSHIGSARNSVRAASFDVGMVQLDSIRVDVDATLSRIEQIYSRRTELVSGESAFLKDRGIRLVVADIPGIPIEAAAALGMPRLAVGNFGWDWIYSEFVPRDVRWKSIVDAFAEQYCETDLLLRLPFCEEMSAFPLIEDIPLVASAGRPCRSKIAELTGSDPERKWFLISFTTLDWKDDALDAVERLRDNEFFTVLPLKWKRNNIHVLDREDVAFPDIVASVDAVISKPGFGIVSDCIVNNKPLIYADRTDFMEYPILEESIRTYLKHLHIPSESLYSGDIGETLSRIWECPEPAERLDAGGDRMAAVRIAAFAKF
ncbi:MAG: hypothetical protein GXX84_18260 [Acidobacteria bacterium]|nr:hypothetical protein [Acidobacteriota bacterium]